MQMLVVPTYLFLLEVHLSDSVCFVSILGNTQLRPMFCLCDKLPKNILGGHKILQLGGNKTGLIDGPHQEREQEISFHNPGSGVHRHSHGGIVLQCRYRIVAFGAHAEGAVRPGEAPVAHAGHDLVRLPVGVGVCPDALIPRNPVKFGQLFATTMDRSGPVEFSGEKWTNRTGHQ